MKPLRRSQIIAPFGVGAMVDFPGPISMIHAGLDSWPIDPKKRQYEEFLIKDEERLAKRLGVKYFVLPPDFRRPLIYNTESRDPNTMIRLPFLRFPLWHRCPICSRMHKGEYHDNGAPVCKDDHKEIATVQVRFIAICPSGHMQDFPWLEWVLKDKSPRIDDYILKMRVGTSASLAGIKLECQEKSTGETYKRSLAGAFQESAFEDLGIECQGHNPALVVPSTNFPAPGCGQRLNARLKGGSDVYYSNYKSSIYIPPVVPGASSEALEILEDPEVRAFIDIYSPKMDEKGCKNILDRRYPHSSVTAIELLNTINADTEAPENEDIDSDDEEQKYRRAEYNILSKDIKDGISKLNLLIESEDLNTYEKLISDNFERISLIKKLRETRAFTGFARIFDTLQLDEKWKLISHERLDWLPGIIVRGEGLFIQFKEDKIRSWIASNEDQLERRLSKMQDAYDNLAENRHQVARDITPRYVLMHTLSHMIINQLIFECGYGSASLRERLYYSDDDNNPMAAILIYTSAGDTEGTMGGLVRMGYHGRLENVLKRALENAQWCSSDPVCIESNGQGPQNCNLAACHACSLLPETSCEEGNRMLDRGVVVGTLEQNSIGFFSNYLEKIHEF